MRAKKKGTITDGEKKFLFEGREGERDELRTHVPREKKISGFRSEDQRVNALRVAYQGERTKGPSFLELTTPILKLNGSRRRKRGCYKKKATAG